MPTTTSTTSRAIPRTYSRRNSSKRKQSIDEAGPDKRRKLSEERDGTDTEQDDASRQPEASTSRVRYTYGTPKRQDRHAHAFPSIFDDVTPASSPLPTPTKLAKRMLSRSKTDTVVVEPSTSIVERTSSLPNMPSSPVRPPLATSFTQPDPIPALPIPKTTNTRTYAGRTRSFLVELPTNDLDALNGAEDETTRESYESLRSRWGVDNSEDDPYTAGSPARSVSSNSTPRKNSKGKGKARQVPLELAPGMMNPLKSITELRNKGESRRFLDEVGYLFEGLDIHGGIGLKRASALEITTKLCDSEFFRKAKAADFFHKTWEVFIEAGAGNGDDKILDTLLIFFTALVSREPSSLEDLAQRSCNTLPDEDESVEQRPLVQTLFTLLDSPDTLTAIGRIMTKPSPSDEAELRKMGIAKKERQMLITIYESIISKSRLFPSGTQISNPLLIYLSLQTLPPPTIPINHLPTLLTSLKSLHPLLFPSQSSISPYLNWSDTSTEIPYQTVYHQLRMLDQYLLGQWGDVDLSNIEGEEGRGKEKRRVQKQIIRVLDEAREGWFVECLVGLLVCCELKGFSSSSSSSSSSKRKGREKSAKGCVEVALRVLVSVTHADENWARKTLECEYAMGCLLRLVLRSWRDARAARHLNHNTHAEVKEEREGRSKGKERMKREMDEEESDDDDSDIEELEGEEEGEEGEEDKATGAIDRLCLALGVLTNLVQTVEGAKDVYREISLDQHCDLSKLSCILRCTCTPSSSSRKEKSKSGSRSTTVNALDVLVLIYQDQQSLAHPSSSSSSTSTSSSNGIKPEPESSSALLPTHSTEEGPIGGETTDTLFLRGHLSVLFGLLMQNSQPNQTYLLSALTTNPSSSIPRTRAKREVLEALVEEANSFAIFCASLSGAGLSTGTGVDNPGDVEDEGRVAREVVRFLEGLRDQA